MGAHVERERVEQCQLSGADYQIASNTARDFSLDRVAVRVDDQELANHTESTKPYLAFGQ